MTVAQRSRARDAIARKGQTVTLAGTSAATYDPTDGTLSGTAYSATAKAVLLPMSPYRKAVNDVKAGDQQLLLAGLTTAGAALTQPPVNAVVTLADGTSKFTLIAVEPLNPDGAGAIMFDCIARGHAA